MNNRENTLSFLDKLNIKYKIMEHKVCLTMKDLENEGVTQLGNVYKNFFLRNAKGNKHFVVSMPENKTVNIQDIAKKIESTRLSFGSDDRLLKHGPTGVARMRFDNEYARFENFDDKSLRSKPQVVEFESKMNKMQKAEAPNFSASDFLRNQDTNENLPF